MVDRSNRKVSFSISLTMEEYEALQILARQRGYSDSRGSGVSRLIAAVAQGAVLDPITAEQAQHPLASINRSYPQCECCRNLHISGMPYCAACQVAMTHNET